MTKELITALRNQREREEWTRRYANRIMEVAGWDDAEAMHVAEVAASENLADNGNEWLDPEEDADVEMSYWENDGDEA